MSFTSSLPANLPKFSYIAVVRKQVQDSASGTDITSSLSRTAIDLALGSELAGLKRFGFDLASGQELSRLVLPALDRGISLDLTSLLSRNLFDRATGLDVVSQLLKTIMIKVFEVAKGTEVALLSVPEPETLLEKCLSRIDMYIPEVDYDREIKAEHYNVVARCCEWMLMVISDLLGKMMERGSMISDEVFDQLERCRSLIAEWRERKAFDIVEPEDENKLINMLCCIEILYNMLPSPVIAFDYIIDIYSDRIIITASDGSTTTLSTISDFNDWLKNIRGKRIRINAYIEVTDDLRLTQNEYVIFGKWIRGNVFLREKNTTIISFTPLGYYSATLGITTYVTNYDPDTDTYLDVSGLRFYSIYANIDIEGEETTWLTDVVICVNSAYDTCILYLNGNLFLRSLYATIGHAKFKNAYIEVFYHLHIGDIYGEDGEGTWYIASYQQTHILGDVSIMDVGRAYLVFYFERGITVGAGRTDYIPLGTLPTSYFLDVEIERYGAEITVFDTQILRTLDPTGITCSVDLSNKRIAVTNNTTQTKLISVIWVEKAS
jgi:hypothetical protein